jgi:hypothetical protein
MAEINFTFNLEQGFRLESDFQGEVGQIANMTIGGQKLPPDLAVADQTRKLYPGNVVGVLSEFAWAGGMADSIQIKAQISVKNRFALKNLQSKAASVQCELRTFQYDPNSGKWFSPLEFAGGTLNGTLKEMALSDTAGSVQTPINYELDFMVIPSGINKLAYATGSGLSVVKFWSGMPAK